MMRFRTLKDNIINVLGAAEAGRYRTVGFQRRGLAASEIEGDLRVVQVYYDSGQFPKSAGGTVAAVQHDITFNIILQVSAQAKGDLAVLNDVGSTPAQRATVLFNFLEASANADSLFDELFDIVFQVLMDARNYNFSMAKGTISNRWISSVQKNEVLEEGEFVTITGSMPLTCRVVEEIAGDTGTPADTIDNTLVVNEDDKTKAGKTVINT